jgi:predicted ester cyclase
MGIAATGKQGTLTGIDIYRISDGKIEEAWSNWDTLGLLQKMDVIPSMG